MTRRAFHTLDVFTDTPFAGNPLAVVLDGRGLDAARMQAIAREFNLSETVFVFDSHDPVNTARLRIFTPASELPFAGHPTIGAAALIAHLRAPEHLKNGLRIVLEENIGAVVCEASTTPAGMLRARFDVPRLPERLRDFDDVDAVAGALSLAPGDIGFDRHVPALWSAGNPLAFVPVATRDALARARPDPALFGRVFDASITGAFVYTRDVENPDHDVRARMFAPLHGIAEDPATGSAAAAFAGLAVAVEKPEDGHHTLVIEQGFEMGRPSLITIEAFVEDGALASATVGGAVVKISQGFIEA